MDKNALKEFLQRKYENPEAFLENVIFPVFGEDNYESSGNYHYLSKHPEDKAAAENAGIVDILALGSIYVEGSQLDVFDITVSSKNQLANSRVGIQQLVRRIISTHSGAFMIFHYKTTDRWDWRFTFCHKGANQLDSTDSKRYTFLLGPGQSCRTAAENFCKLGNKIANDGEFEMDDIIKAFDVEALSKEFFDKYKTQYEKFVSYMADPANGMRNDFIDTDFEHAGLSDDEITSREEKPLRDYVKKLLGRIVFLHFIQKKGWLGVEEGKEWGEGDLDFMINLFNKATESQQENFLDEILEPLFEEALNTNRTDKGDLYDTKVSGLPNHGVLKIPYLNGGLFEREASDEPDSKFPSEYFKSLLTFLSQYNFTIDENDPNDAQVGIDPEMLGRIFENLLEDNKDKGTYYTPKEVVYYMCRESLILHLQKGRTDTEQESIRNFVTYYDISYLTDDLKEYVLNSLKAVKICDPAIGSGAFPMGLLKEIFYCRGAIENFDEAVEIKKEIIQNNIYGVDIEKGAVDIARLRFWLSIIVDEKTPHCLPNMDFKIMQGNSLVEDFRGVDLSGIADDTNSKKRKNHDDKQLALEFDEKYVLSNLHSCIRNYYRLTEHSKKTEARLEINNLVKSYIKKYVQEDPTISRSIDELPIPNSEFFLWHTYFADVFKNGGFNIIIGNPPYNGISQNNGDDIKALIEDYKKEPGTNNSLKERKLWLQDDYVKFIRKMEDFIEASNDGILAFINNSSFIDNPTFRGMRWHLMNSFDEIKILDLHGNSRKNNTAGQGEKDENVFNIMQGVSINIFVKKAKPAREELATIHHCEIIGTKKKKRELLNMKPFPLPFTEVSSIAPFYFLMPQNRDGIETYEQGFSIPDLMSVCVTGVVTARDGLVIDMDKKELLTKIKTFADPSKTDDEVRQIFFGNKKAGKYLPGDSRGWKLPDARKKISNNDHKKIIIPLAFRVLDNRYIYYSSDMVDWSREDIYVKHVLNKNNICLVVPRQTTKDWKHVFVTSTVANFNFLATGGQNGAGTHFPLYLYEKSGDRVPNLNSRIWDKINQRVGKQTNAEDILSYIYAILHSTSYRKAYMEFLKKDFPIIPYPKDLETFNSLVRLGKKLIDLHLFKSLPQEIQMASFVGEGDCTVEKISYSADRVYINKSQYFDDIDEITWDAEIGDDKPAQRWLKERKGYILFPEDLSYYQQLTYILHTSKLIVSEIDNIEL